MHDDGVGQMSCVTCCFRDFVELLWLFVFLKMLSGCFCLYGRSLSSVRSYRLGRCVCNLPVSKLFLNPINVPIETL